MERWARVSSGRGRIDAAGGSSRGCSGRMTRVFDGASESNGGIAFLFVDRRARQGRHVPKILLPGSAEALLRKEKSGSLWRQHEQYLESIEKVKVQVERA